MFVYVNNDLIDSNVVGVSKLELLNRITSAQNDYEILKRKIAELDNVSSYVDLGDNQYIYPVDSLVVPTENTEIFSYTYNKMVVDSVDKTVNHVWHKIPLELSIAINNCVEKYHRAKTKLIRETEYAFGEKIVDVGDFILQSVRAKSQIENGATQVEMRLKNGNALSIDVPTFESAYSQVASQYISQCNSRDDAISHMREALSVDALEELWNVYKNEI